MRRFVLKLLIFSILLSPVLLAALALEKAPAVDLNPAPSALDAAPELTHRYSDWVAILDRFTSSFSDDEKRSFYRDNAIHAVLMRCSSISCWLIRRILPRREIGITRIRES